MAAGYPFFYLKANIDEDFVARVVAPMGGTKFDGAQKFPDGVRPVDFLVRNYALEFKRIERDPIVTVPERAGKIADFAIQKALTGETPAQGKTINLKGAVSQLYWRRYAGACVGRAMSEAAEQVRSTRSFLNRPELKGAVFIVNVAAPFIDAESFNALVGAQRARFKAELDLALFFCAIPSVIEGASRPVVLFGFHTDGTEHVAFAEEFEGYFQRELAASLGKKSLDMVSAPKVLPMRFPFVAEASDGTSITIH